MKLLKKSRRILTLIVIGASIFSLMIINASAATSDTARNQLDALVNNIKGSSCHEYNATDSAGHTMDCLKVIPNPSVSGSFIGVYHCYFNKGSTAYVCLATSTDLMNWTFVRTLAGSSGANATQPSILAVGTAFMMAWEQEPNNHVKIVYYNSWSALQSGTIAKSLDCSRSLSSYAEGTPNIYSATSTTADIGFHYYANGVYDRQAEGTMSNWTTWTETAKSNIDNSILYWGVKGNIGDRDGKLSFGGYLFNIHEGQMVNGDFSSWRIFIYDWQTGNSDKLAPVTENASTSFANPTFETVTINSKRALLVTLFMPTEGNSSSEKGECIYYTYY